MKATDIVSIPQLEVALGHSVYETRAMACIEEATAIAMRDAETEMFNLKHARHIRGVIRAFVLMAARDLYLSQEISEDALSLLRPFTGPQPQQERG